ncbi:hypothetical protein CC1G_14192 [Coprinopsis cinerea okayama7|uniref:Ubiquitin-like domain-containing protein n=1 Tax=Coprinopsis cinerea (strain Okayama-7 / 130 / ATCC MYA-4618 / FGSC 9003) TaxID=240176 RepID=D6RLM1_COPC7|nr:hypothetical protein CC1G_14192 [Coprinopsis cinerea okayama7\|eukprot:XP_002911659.1 hypothetical protein CC1G_14192 [Coprinopsis cinerea okayama7\
MLSEKAKGKQRASDPPENDSSNSTQSDDEPATRELVIRFTEGGADLTVSVGKEDTIRATRPELKDRKLRLIHLGRLLTDGTYLYSWLASLEERQRRAAEANNEDGLSWKPSTIWIHCSIGPKLATPEDELREDTTSGQLQPVRGFDRLASVGFTEEDIANFRRQFHSQSSMNYLDMDFETEEEYDEHARALEEQWIDSLDNAGTANLSQASNSTHASVLQGVVIGFFFPLIPLFFMRARKPAVFWEDGTPAETPSNVIFTCVHVVFYG